MTNKKRISLFLFCIAISVIVALLLTFSLYKYFHKTSSNKTENATGVPFSDNIDTSNSVLVVKDGVAQRVDLDKSIVSQANPLENENLDGFSGLPDFVSKEVQNRPEMSVLLVSRNGNKFIVEANTGNQSNNFGDNRYICDIMSKACQKSDILSVNYEGLESEKKEQNDFWWFGWDSDKNLLWGYAIGGQDGDFPPVYACDIQSKKCEKTGDGTDGEENKVARIPEGTFGPDLGSFVMYVDEAEKESGLVKKRELVLYESGDLTKPSKVFDITATAKPDDPEEYDGSIESITWNKSGKRIVISTEGKIFLLNLDDGSLTEVYGLKPIDDDGLEWYLDGSSVAITPNGRFIAFVEQAENSSQQGEGDEQDNEGDENEAAGDTIMVLKKIDLENNNQSAEVMWGNDLYLKTSPSFL